MTKTARGVLLGGCAFAIALVACGGTDTKNDEANKPVVTNPTNLNGANPADGGAASTPPASGATDTKLGDANKDDPKKQPPEPGQPGEPGEPGASGRISVNEHCCVDGKYFRCPNSRACFGGFDLGTCLEACDIGDPCWERCFDQLGNSGAPTGCDGNVPAPPNVDCANGQIND